mgnify:CR=1 FL=1
MCFLKTKISNDSFRLFAIFTMSGYNHCCLYGSKANWEFYRRYGYFIEANGCFTLVTNKMYMVIVVMAFFTVVFTKGV